MLNVRNKLDILFYNFSLIFKYKLTSNKNFIIWGRSPYLEYGPGIRTRRLKKIIEKESINKVFIYMQSHWPWYEIIIYTLVAKLLSIKIIFNQNGIYTKKYRYNYKFNNLILIFGIINSSHIIYQSWFCYKSIMNICPAFLRNIIESKKFCRLINPSIDHKFKIKNLKIKKHKILICNSFSKDKAYYSKYILKLLPKLNIHKSVDEINIIGNICKNLNKEEIMGIEKLNKLNLCGKLSNKKVLNYINKSTVVIHLNYGDPCPNFISEVISFGIPCILNKEGGAIEIAGKGSIYSKNLQTIEGYSMPKIEDVIKSLNKLIYNYKYHREQILKRSQKLQLKKYVKKHKEIINNL